MGLTEGLQSGGNQKYLTIKNGILAERCSESTPGAVAVKKDDGSTVHELHHKSITGYLKSVTVRTHDEYGDYLKIGITSKGVDYIVECKLDSGYATGFLTTIPSADIEGLIQISPSYDEKEKKSKVFLQQDAGWLKAFFTKENPNGLPQLNKVKVNGKEVWDKTDRLEFFKNMIAKLNAKLMALHATETETEEVATKESPIKAPF
jgi:hypothetical protein